VDRIVEIPIDKIDRNPNQPRKFFDDEKHKELVASVRRFGVLQPILVRPKGGRYEFVAGERRLRAAREAGLKMVPCIVKDLDDREALEISLTENLQRQDLNPIEEAEAYKMLIERYGYTQTELAKKLGKSQAHIANRLRLLKTPKSMREAILRQIISAWQAQAILGLKREEWMESLLNVVVENGYSVARIRKIVKALNEGDKRFSWGTGSGIMVYYVGFEDDVGEQLEISRDVYIITCPRNVTQKTVGGEADAKDKP